MNKKKLSLNVFDKHRYVKNTCLIVALSAGLVGSGMMPQISKGTAGYQLAIGNVAMAASANVQWISGNGLPDIVPTDIDSNYSNDSNSEHNKLWHWASIYSLVKEPSLHFPGYHNVRGNFSASYSSNVGDSQASNVTPTIGWRPVLEVQDTDSLIAGRKDGDIVKFGTLYYGGSKYPTPINPTEYGDLLNYSSNIPLEIRDTESDNAYKLQWVLATNPSTGKKLLICDRNLAKFINFNILDSQGLVTGKNINIEGGSYKCRLLTGGTNINDKNNEWDQIIAKGDGAWHIDSIYNIDDITKCGSWFNGFYGKASNANNEFMQFTLSGADGTSTMHSGGIIQNESSIRGKYFIDNGVMILIDNYGMVQYYKDFSTTNPDTLSIDGDTIDHVGTLIFGNGTIKTVLYMKDGSLKYVDTDESIHDMALKQSDIVKTFAYKYADGQSQKMLIQKPDGSLVYLDNRGNVQNFGINMNDVAYTLQSTDVNKDLFVMKGSTITLRDDTGTIAAPSGLTINKIWSNRIFEMSDGYLYTLQNGTFNKTTTLAKIADKAKNQAILLKNGNFQTVDASGNLNNLADINGSNVKSFVQLDSTNQYILMNDGTTYGIGSNVQGDKLESHGIDINSVKSMISNGATNISKVIVMDSGDVYVNQNNSWVKSTYVKLNSNVVNLASAENGVYLSSSEIPVSKVIEKGTVGDSLVDTAIMTATAPVDKTAPMIAVSGNPTDWTNSDATINVTASDETGGSGVASITLPDGTVVNGSNTSFKATQNGTYTIKATDKAGNVATQTVTVSRIDKTAPTAPTISNNNGTVTIIPGTDSDSGAKETDYSIDGGAWNKYIGAVTILPSDIETPQGYIEYTPSSNISAKTVDNAGNVSQVSVSQIVSETIIYKDSLDRAELLVSEAEKDETQASINIAKSYVDYFPDGDTKAGFENRLQNVQDKINQSAQQTQAVKDATDAVNKAQQSQNQSDLDNAKEIVSKLPEGADKTNLENQINSIQDNINKNKAEEQAAQDLAKATTAVQRAEITGRQSDVSSAKKLVDALPDSQSKTDLENRLQAIQNKIDSDNAAIKKVQDALGKANSTLAQDDITAAQEAINELPAGIDKVQYNNQLRIIQQKVQITIAVNINNANAAVTKVSRTKSITDLNMARNLVNALPNCTQKTKLNNILNIIERFCK